MTRVEALDDPQLRAFAPLIFVAWSDDDLDDEVRARVLAQIAAEPWLRPAARATLAAWLDPARPPSAHELAQLHALIARVATTASPRARLAFARIARDVAGDPEAREAAERIARELGMFAGAPAAVRDADRASVDELRAALDGEHGAIRARVRAFLGDHRAYGLPVAEQRAQVRGWLREFAATGLGDLAFPGVTSDGDLAQFTAVFEELGHGDLSLLVKIGVQLGLYGGAIWALGTDRHRARLARVARFEELGCFAMSEVGHGSNVAGIETTATYVDGELELHTPGESARKEWIGGAAHDARWAVVFAQLEVGGERQGVHAVLVPIRDAAGDALPGVRTGDSGHKLGLNGVDNGRLWFERVRVPVANLLDRFASITDGVYASPIASPDKRFFTMLGALVGGRISVASAAVSAARTALAIAVRYAHARRQFGDGEERLLVDYPTHRARLLPHVADAAVLRIACAALRARHADPQTDARLLEAQAAAMKVRCSRHAIAAVQEAREACGGQGYLSVNRIPMIRADVDIFTTFEGDNTVLAQLVGKALLGAQRKRLAAGGSLAVLRAVARRLVPRNPVAARRTDDVLDRDFHLAALAHREAHLVETCLLRIKKRVDGGLDGDAALLAVQEHVVAIATAYAEHLALADFGAREGVLGTLGALYGLNRLVEHAAWFLEAGYLEAGKLRAIRKAREALLAELAPLSRDLVDAYAIPDACLAAPIAFFDPAHPSY